MKYIIYTVCFLSAAVFSNLASAQNVIPKALMPDNTELQSRLEKTDPAGWLYFKEDADILQGELFYQLKGAMGLGTNDEMQPVNSETDSYGTTHNKYRQLYQGILVEGAEYSEHVKNCKVQTAHGKIVENLTLGITPQLSESQALQSALNQINAQQYAWQNPLIQNIFDEETGITSNYYPKGSLIVGYVNRTGMVATNYKLVWRFTIHASQPVFSNEVYIDAQTGAMLKNQSIERNEGPAVLRHSYGTRTIDTQWRGGFKKNHT